MKIIILTFIMLTILNTSSFGKFNFIGEIKSFKKFDDSIEFKLENSLFNIYMIKENVIRFRYTNKKNFSEAPSYAVIKNESISNYNFSETENYFEIKTSELVVRISKNPCRVSIYDKNMNLINEDEESFGVSYDFDEVRCFKKLFKDEIFYGLGEKTGNLQKTRNQYTMWNSDTPGYNEKTDPVYQSIPFFIGIRNKKAYGIFLDNTYKSYFNMGASNKRFYWFGAEKGELDYYFINGPEIKKVISSYTELTGRMELPPKWALGYQQSRWSYFPESRVREIAKTFRDKQIPCDVIYLDIHYMNDYRVFTWDKNRFPDPQKMLNSLSKDGFKIITIVDPGVKADTVNYSIAKEGLKQNLFAKFPDGEVYQGEVWPSWAYFPDFTKKETRIWWGEKNADLLKQGIAGIWNDMNEPAVWGASFPDIVQFDDNGFKADHKKIHNVYGLEMAHATFDGLKNEFPNKRPFILTRAGFSGIQRYAAVWTGDNVASEEHLKLACTMVLGMGISGVPFCGSDVGGFMGTPSPNLYLRWMQLGAFTPFFRGHSVINASAKEPWAFGEEIEKWVKDIISLRYELLPYFYNEFYIASKTGLPIMRSMFLNFQNDDECYAFESQYQFMIGENLLVAPVVSENEKYKKVYLPEGRWLDWWNKKIYDGNKWIIVEAPSSVIPLFIKEGGIIPMQEKQNYVGEKNITELKLKIFPSENSSYVLYEDDGQTTDYKNGEYSLTKFEVSKISNSITLNISKEKDDYKTNREDYLITFYDVDESSSVKNNDASLNPFDSLDELKNQSEGYYFDQNNSLLTVKIKEHRNMDIQIKAL